MIELSKFMEESKKEIQTGWFIAELSDEYIVDEISEMNSDEWGLSEKENKVLEIRAFNEKMEYKLFRTNISKEFAYRAIKDGENIAEHIDEEQFLDIDEARSMNLNNGNVVTTGGGLYHLPLKNHKNARIKVRYYLEKYAKTGQARVADWRLVGFEEG